MTRPPHSPAQSGNEPGLFRYVRVEKHLLDLIEAGGTRARGTGWPSLRTLGARLGVSVSTINQAYVALERRGVLEARPRSGFFVREVARRPPTPLTAVVPAKPPTTINRGALIREVLAGMGRRDIVPLGVALTDEVFLPTKTITRILAKVATSGEYGLATYEGVSGHLPLRRQIAWRLAEAGIEARPEDIMVTSGAMEALYIALRSVTRPGDNVAIAAPTYYCFLQLLENFGLRAVELPSHPDGGVRPADLQTALDRFDVRAVILTPNFNNPDGSMIPDPAKAEIAAMAAARGVPIIEDDVYGDLHLQDRRPRCIRSFDAGGGVLHCSSFSKSLAPGFRIGYLLPGRFAAKAFEIKATTNVCCATPTQVAVAHYLAQGGFERHLRQLRAVLGRQVRLMQAQILRHFPAGTRVTDPAGGSVLWVQLPETRGFHRPVLRGQTAGHRRGPGQHLFQLRPVRAFPAHQLRQRLDAHGAGRRGHPGRAGPKHGRTGGRRPGLPAQAGIARNEPWIFGQRLLGSTRRPAVAVPPTGSGSMERLALEETERSLIFGLSGEIIMDVVPELRDDIQRLADQSDKPVLVADLGRVTFMDSSGVGLLLGTRRFCEERGKTFTLANPSPPIKKLLGVLRLTEYFAVSPTRLPDRRTA